MTVPHYKLPRLHCMLDERGLLEGALVTKGYRAVLQNAASKAPSTPTPTATTDIRIPAF
jgi:fatty acid desaturase